MSAKDDYPADGGAVGGTAELYGGKYEAMCDEIDRLRAVEAAMIELLQEAVRSGEPIHVEQLP